MFWEWQGKRETNLKSAFFEWGWCCHTSHRRFLLKSKVIKIPSFLINRFLSQGNPRREKEEISWKWCWLSKQEKNRIKEKAERCDDDGNFSSFPRILWFGIVVLIIKAREKSFSLIIFHQLAIEHVTEHFSKHSMKHDVIKDHLTRPIFKRHIR